MRILFLDMDGVMNSAKHFKVMSKTKYKKIKGMTKVQMRHVDMIDPEAVPLLNTIIERGDFKVVLSSTWRILYSAKQVQSMLEVHGFKGDIIGSTPTHILAPEPTNENQRGCEIQAWLDSNYGRPHEIVILDDSSDMAHLRHRLVQTSWERGLLQKHVELALSMIAVRY